MELKIPKLAIVVGFAVFFAAMASYTCGFIAVIERNNQPEPPPPKTTIEFETLLVDSDGTAIAAQFTIEGADVAALARGHRWQIMTPREIIK